MTASRGGDVSGPPPYGPDGSKCWLASLGNTELDPRVDGRFSETDRLASRRIGDKQLVRRDVPLADGGAGRVPYRIADLRMHDSGLAGGLRRAGPAGDSAGDDGMSSA